MNGKSKDLAKKINEILIGENGCDAIFALGYILVKAILDGESQSNENNINIIYFKEKYLSDLQQMMRESSQKGLKEEVEE